MTDTAPTTIAIGFLSIQQEAGGYLGGYLVTNSWGRPLEFRLTSAVHPNRVQEILYGPTLSETIHVDLIGKTVIEKTSTPPTLIVTDAVDALLLWDRLNVPTITFGEGFTHERCSVSLKLPASRIEEQATVTALLDQLDPAIDLAEPFQRIREAVSESRKLGGANRAA